MYPTVRKALSMLCASIAVILFSFLVALPASASTEETIYATPAYEETIDATPTPLYHKIISPRTEADVPKGLHTYAQSVMIEVLSAAVCQLVGVDPVDPSIPCLGINPETRELGYVSNSDVAGKPQVGGILGASAQMVGMMYTPTVGTNDYIKYMAHNFSIVKQAQAQEFGYGFSGLSPLIEVWKAFRNISYMLLTLAFIFIGLGVMLRVKIDPRTVMTIQNQLPRIVISILLITFSYAIAAIMVDLMWVTTYVGINVVSSAAPNADLGDGNTLSKKATTTILQTPIVFANQVFHTPDANGIFHITDNVSLGLSNLMTSLVQELFGINDKDADCIGFLHLDPRACIANVIGFLTRIVLELVIFITILVVLFRVWFSLLKAYAFVLLYTIVGPIYIVFGLLPGRPLGFEKWARALFANLAVFPFTAVMFVGARVFSELFNAKPQAFVPPSIIHPAIAGGATQQDLVGQFIPPLVGNPNMPAFGTIIGFGMILMIPTLLDQLKDALKVQGNKYGGAAMGALAAGGAVAAAPANKTWAHLNRVNPTTGQPIGMLAERKQALGRWAMNKGAGAVSKTSEVAGKVPGLKKAGGWVSEKAQKAAAKHEYIQEHGSTQGFSRHYDETHPESASVQRKAARQERKLAKKADKEWKKNHPDQPNATREQRIAAYTAAHPEAAQVPQPTGTTEGGNGNNGGEGENGGESGGPTGGTGPSGGGTGGGSPRPSTPEGGDSGEGAPEPESEGETHTVAGNTTPTRTRTHAPGESTGHNPSASEPQYGTRGGTFRGSGEATGPHTATPEGTGKKESDDSGKPSGADDSSKKTS